MTLSQLAYLLVFSPTHFEKYAHIKLDHSCRYRGENSKKSLEPPARKPCVGWYYPVIWGLFHEPIIISSPISPDRGIISPGGSELPKKKSSETSHPPAPRPPPKTAESFPSDVGTRGYPSSFPSLVASEAKEIARSQMAGMFFQRSWRSYIRTRYVFWKILRNPLVFVSFFSWINSTVQDKHFHLEVDHDDRRTFLLGPGSVRDIFHFNIKSLENPRRSHVLLGSFSRFWIIICQWRNFWCLDYVSARN